MTPHTHREIVPGCYRCELSSDEAIDAAVDLLVSKGIDTIEKYDALIAAIDAQKPPTETTTSDRRAES